RFLLFRVETMTTAQIEMCHLKPGKTPDMRARIADAVADLFASLPDPLPEPARMNDQEYASLSKVVLEVIKLRAGVVRDRYRRESADVLPPERPARLVLAPQHLSAGLSPIGVDRGNPAPTIEQIAYDSAPKPPTPPLRSMAAEASLINFPAVP